MVALVSGLAEFGWTTLSGEPHYGEVVEVDSNVIFIDCWYCGKRVGTEGTDEDFKSLQLAKAEGR